MKTSKHYTHEQVEFIKSLDKQVNYQEATNLFNERFNENRTINGIKRLMCINRVKCKHNGRFKKGQIPFNKGLKGVYNVGGNITSFKKGNRPHNYLPIGTELMRDDGYIWVKIADPNKWKQKHRLIWEEVFGPIPKGKSIVFKNQNKEDISLDNLILINKATLLRMNRKSCFLNKHLLQKQEFMFNK